MRQFCEAFRDNNNTISYGFRRIIASKIGNEMFSYYIFVNQSYWTLKTDDQITNVSLESSESNESNWFGSQYSIALCVMKDYSSEDCTPYLLEVSPQKKQLFSIENIFSLTQKSLSKWVFGALESDLKNLNMKSKVKKLDNTNKNINQKTIGFSSGHNLISLKERDVVFYNQYPTNSITVFNMKKTDNPVNNNITKLTQQTFGYFESLRSLSNQTQVVAIFHTNFNSLLILSVKGPMIYYCNVVDHIYYDEEVSRFNVQ